MIDLKEVVAVILNVLPLFVHRVDAISVKFGRFSPEKADYHRHDLNGFGEVPTMECVIFRGTDEVAQRMFRQYDGCLIFVQLNSSTFGSVRSAVVWCRPFL